MAYFWSLITLALTIIGTNLVIGANVKVRATCAGDMVFFADGKKYGSNNDMNSLLNVDIPDYTQVIAIKCTASTSHTLGGILVSMKDEYEADYITDATWKCNSKHRSGWNSAGYNDNRWPYATVTAQNNGNNSAYSQFSDLKNHVKWIWSSQPDTATGDLKVFCRGRMAIDRTHDSYGRVFAVGFMENLKQSPRKNITLLITTVIPVSVSVRISTPRLANTHSQYLDTALTVSAGDVAKLVLPRDLRHENTHALQNFGILILSTKPIRVVGENQEMYSTDLCLFLPVTSLGGPMDRNEYYAVTWDFDSNNRLLVVTAYDNTHITFNSPNGIIYIGGINRPKNTDFTVTIPTKYQSLQLSSYYGFTGTRIVSDRPISAFSGNKKAVVSNLRSGVSSDHLVEQLLPVKTWGKKYIVTPLPYSDNGTLARMGSLLERYKILSAENNTNITVQWYNRSTGQELGSDKFLLSPGTEHLRNHVRGTIAIIEADKGITVVQFATTMMTSSTYYNTLGNCIGDPWMQIIPPVEEYFRDYALLTPKLVENYDCKPKHFVTIIVDKSKKEGITINNQNLDWSGCDNDDDCAEIPTTNMIYKTVNIPYGTHRVQHNKTNVNFALFFFGYGRYDSYATMGGSRMAPVNEPCTKYPGLMGDGIDNDCDGQIDEDECLQNDPSQDCGAPSPVNGGWSEWKPSGACTCEPGKSTGQIRYYRLCDNPVPLFNGWPCLSKTESDTKYESCQCVSIDGGWNDWSDWSDCYPDCGQGTKERTRSCVNPYPANGGQPCSGDRKQETSCFVKNCTGSGPVTTTKAPPTGRLLPYGSSTNDNAAFTITDMRTTTHFATEIQIPNTPFLTNNMCRKCYMGISSAGYVAIRSKRSKYDTDMFLSRVATKWKNAFTPQRRWAMEFSGGYVLAPFWSDTRFILGEESQVYYNIYKRKHAKKDDNAKLIMDTCNDRVKQYTGFSNFSATHVAVVTWENMMPTRRNARNEYNTFQLALFSDRRNRLTFALYLYDHMTWTSLQAVHVGYYLHSKFNAESKSYTNTKFSNLREPFNKKSPYLIDTRKDKFTGEKGEAFHTLAFGAENLDYEEECIAWYDREAEKTPVPPFTWYNNWNTTKYLNRYKKYTQHTRFCPCDVRSARDDWRWRRDGWEKKRTGKLCFVQRQSTWYTTQTCCYDNKTRSLITSKDGSGGHTYLFHPKWWWSRGFYKQHDEPYKDYCCSKSNNCDKFYEMRPLFNCRRYRPPRISWFWGDPHITTLDGHQYIFNGLGEYILIQTQNQNFTLQGRTEQTYDVNSNAKAATVFTAIAAQDTDGDVVQVELNSNRDGIILYAAGQDITSSWFTPTADDEDNSSYQKVVITKVSMTEVTLAFATGFSVSVSYGQSQLSITISAPDEFKGETAGLLGVYNDDINDDFTTRSGTQLSISSTEAEIYTNFGETWKTSSSESIFTYHSGKTHASYINSTYTPVYLEDLQKTFTTSQWSQITTACSGNMECMFDLAMTGNSDLANLTMRVNQNNLAVSANLANSRPVITVDEYLNVTIQQEATLSVQVSDNDINDTTTLSFTFTKQSDGSDMSSVGTLINNIFKWTPTTTDAVTLKFTATDSQGGSSSEETVIIRFCDCLPQNGVCNFEEIRADQSTGDPFQYVECQCNTGWTGDNCTEDKDGCLDNPCGCNITEVCTGSNSVCYDVVAINDTVVPGGAFVCGPCNSGYEKRELSNSNSDCINSDECTDVTHDCDSNNGICVDTIGSFTCSCVSGYRLNSDGKNCDDINECSEGTSGCEHTCTNSPGSFQCSCENGHTLQSDNKTCSLNSSLTTSCTSSGCDHCRLNSSGSGLECFCPLGYTLHVNNKNCDDINECISGTHTCHVTTSICSNNGGSYDCVCNDGYILQADNRTCKECEPGFWGPGCVNICSCKEDTVCNVTTGCTECSDSGFTGSNCDVDIDECLQTDACGSNTASCVNRPGSYYCTCNTGYQAINSTHCKDIDDCASVPCLNGGECTNLDGLGYTCQCVDGYTGTNCETDINECASSPCQNGGLCTDLINQYRCTCTSNFIGVNCKTSALPTLNEQPIGIGTNDGTSNNQSDTNQQTSEDSSNAAALGVGIGMSVLAITLVALTIAAIVYFLKKEKRPPTPKKNIKVKPQDAIDVDDMIEPVDPQKGINTMIPSVAPNDFRNTFYVHDDNQRLFYPDEKMTKDPNLRDHAAPGFGYPTKPPAAKVAKSVSFYGDRNNSRPSHLMSASFYSEGGCSTTSHISGHNMEATSISGISMVDG